MLSCRLHSRREEPNKLVRDPDMQHATAGMWSKWGVDEFRLSNFAKSIPAEHQHGHGT
jgi:hypothetical protein